MRKVLTITKKIVSYSRKQKAVEESEKLNKSDEFRAKTGDIHTTKEESLKQIDAWLGLGTQPKTKLWMILFYTLLTLISLSVVIVDKEFPIKLVFALFALLFICLALLDLTDYQHDTNVMRYEKLKEKTLDTKYLVSEDIINCPIEVKKDLLDMIDSGFVYLNVGLTQNPIRYFKENGDVERLPQVLSVEYDFFKSQLEPCKLYKIADIVTNIAKKDN